VAFFIPQNRYYNHMKFAVIEYTTKTGQIWRPTPERPNYLGDPQREIDPTSFACYTTALQGEHIPLTWLINPNLLKKVIKRLTGAWPQWHSLDYQKKFDALMVVHQLSNAHEILALTKRLKKEQPNQFIIGVPTQPYGLLKKHLDQNQKDQQIFSDYMNTCDVFLTVVKSTQGYYKALTKTPVVYMPQPYPYHYAKDFALSLQQKDKTILVAGVTQRPNIKQGQLVAVELQKLLPDYQIIIPKVPELDYDETNLKNSNYKILPFEQWREHLKTLAKTSLVINTDYTQTRGRVQTDCAAVKTISLGGNSDGQADLFPDLISTPQTSVSNLVKLGHKILTDADYYKNITHNASERLKKYDYEASATRLMALVKTYNHV